MSALGVGSAGNIEKAKMKFLQRWTIPNLRGASFLQVIQLLFANKIS